MTTTLHVAERSDSVLIENLMQFYCYDFSEPLPDVRVGADGKFAPHAGGNVVRRERG